MMQESEGMMDEHSIGIWDWAVRIGVFGAIAVSAAIIAAAGIHRARLKKEQQETDKIPLYLASHDRILFTRLLDDLRASEGRIDIKRLQLGKKNDLAENVLSMTSSIANWGKPFLHTVLTSDQLKLSEDDLKVLLDKLPEEILRMKYHGMDIVSYMIKCHANTYQRVLLEHDFFQTQACMAEALQQAIKVGNEEAASFIMNRLSRYSIAPNISGFGVVLLADKLQYIIDWMEEGSYPQANNYDDVARALENRSVVEMLIKPDNHRVAKIVFTPALLNARRFKLDSIASYIDAIEKNVPGFKGHVEVYKNIADRAAPVLSEELDSQGRMTTNAYTRVGSSSPRRRSLQSREEGRLNGYENGH